jgi:hypothetical protein
MWTGVWNWKARTRAAGIHLRHRAVVGDPGVAVRRIEQDLDDLPLAAERRQRCGHLPGRAQLQHVLGGRDPGASGL